MDKNDDLQIHSNVSIPIMPEHVEESNSKEQDPYIRHGNYKGFIRKTALLLFVLHLPMLVAAILQGYNKQKFEDLFTNYSSVYNPYSITFFVVFVLSHIAISVIPLLARGLSRMIFLLVIYGLGGYLEVIYLRHAGKVTGGRFFIYELRMVYLIFLCGSFGLLINTLITKKKFNPRIGVAISFVLYSIVVLIMELVLSEQEEQIGSSPYLWEYGLWFGGATLYAVYINYDVRLMINKRDDFYLQKDWFLGMVHLNTDIAFRFWYYFFVAQKNPAISVNNDFVVKDAEEDYGPQFAIGRKVTVDTTAADQL